MFRLDGRVALITGSTRGIGWAIARTLAEAGATVVVNGRTDEAVGARVDELAAAGWSAVGAAFDVAEIDGLATQVDGVVGRMGRIDILVNNAGIQRRGPIETFERTDWELVLATNLSAPFLLSQAAARHMLGAGWGRILNLGSLMGTLARPTVPAYAGSKSGLHGLTRALAVELGGRGITVNALAPGYIATELNTALMADPEFDAKVVTRTPAGRWGTVEEVATAALYLVSEQASYVNGHVLTVDGGMSIAL